MCDAKRKQLLAGPMQICTLGDRDEVMYNWFHSYSFTTAAGTTTAAITTSFLLNWSSYNIRGGNVHSSVGMSVRPSTKSLSDFNEIWYVHRSQ